MGSTYIGRCESQSQGPSMNLTPDVLRIDPVQTESRITRFVRNYVAEAKVPGIILGISGGIDSAVCGAICAKAIGGAKVLGVNMPEAETLDEAEMQDAKLVSKMFGIDLVTVDISDMVKTFFRVVPVFDVDDRIANGNVKARIRMAVLYYYANRLRWLVAGSSDKSELMLGYFTKWGDGCADILPIADLYKTQVRQLASHLALPSRLVEKPPSPNLWPGQTAKEELGLGYDELDLALYGLEHFMTADEISKELGLPIEVVKDIEARWLRSEHKRRSPLSVKLSYRSVGHDFRLPYSMSP